MKDKAQFTGIVLKVDNRILCRKVILAARSEHFQSIFHCKESKEMDQRCVEHGHLEHAALQMAIISTVTLGH